MGFESLPENQFWSGEALMAKAKLTRKELKGPDEFQQTVVRVVNFLKDYGAYIGGVLAVAVIGLVGGLLVSRHLRSVEVERSAGFFKSASPILNQLLKGATDSKDASKQLAEAVKGIAQFKEHVSESELRLLADYVEGLGLSRQDPSKALARLKAAAEGSVGKVFGFIAWEAFGAVAERAGKANLAETAYSRMQQSGSSLARAVAYLHVGDLMVGSGEVQKAIEAYKKGLGELSGEPALMSPGTASVRAELRRKLMLAEAGMLFDSQQPEKPSKPTSRGE